jgi:hypothetical protein
MDYLKCELIFVQKLRRFFLQREQLFGAQITLVVRGSGTGKNRFAEIVGSAHFSFCFTGSI